MAFNNQESQNKQTAPVPQISEDPAELRPSAQVAPLKEENHQSEVVLPEHKINQDSIHAEPLGPIPAQNSLPSDSYVYANTSTLGGVIKSTAEQYGLDAHELEALTNVIRNKKGNLEGIWAAQVGYYPGMSAESLVTNIGRVLDISNVMSAHAKQTAQMEGKAYNSSGLEQIVNGLSSTDPTKSAKDYFHDTLSSLQKADHVQFDNDTLAQFYELQVQAGVDKATAWQRTMGEQDKYRSAQDTRAVMQDFNIMRDPKQMQTYTEQLYARLQTEKDPDTKIRLAGQYSTAAKMTAQYAEAFQKDPANFIMTKDPMFKNMMEEADKKKDYSEVIKQLDKRYNELGIPETERTYLTQTQAKTLSKQINDLLAEDPAKAQATLINIMSTYKQGASKAIGQLIRENKVNPTARVLIEAARTGSPVANGDVLDMIKYKMNLKNDFLKTMLNAPDASTATTLQNKLNQQVRNIPGYKAIVQNLEMAGNIRGKIELDQYYADMAAFYKYKHPNLSDKQVVALVQNNLIDSTYSYDTAGRVVLQKRTLDGKPIMYNKYSPEQASQYLTNRGFSGLGYSVSNKSKDISDALLRNKQNIKFRVLDQNTVQPYYHDVTTGVSELILDKHSKPLKLNLKYLGNEDVIGTINARESMRKTLSQLQMVGDSAYNVNRDNMYGIEPNAPHNLRNIFKASEVLKKASLDKPLKKDLERTNLSPKQIEALSNATNISQQFDLALQNYEKLQRLQRETAHNALQNGFDTFKAFNSAILPLEKASKVLQETASQNARKSIYKEELKKQREHIYELEKQFLHQSGIFLDYKGTIQARPFTQYLDEHLYDKIWYGGY